MKTDDQSLSQLLDILGNENRRKIIALLEIRSCFVTEISERLSISPKAVIDHLMMLEEAQIITHQFGANRRKYYHLSHDLDITIQKVPKERRIVPADPSAEHQYRDGLHNLHNLCDIRDHFFDEMQNLDRQIDNQLDQIMKAGSHAGIPKDEIMISAALVHDALTVEEIMNLCMLPRRRVEEILGPLVEQGFVTHAENKYRLRSVDSEK